MYSSTTKCPCIDCAIYQLNIQLGANIGIEVQWSLRITDTLGTWLLSVVEGLSASRSVRFGRLHYIQVSKVCLVSIDFRENV